MSWHLDLSPREPRPDAVISDIMLDTEGRWSEALASNDVRVLIRWLRKLEGDADMEEVLPTFSCWVQRTSEFAKKELLTFCFSRCQSLWMFLDRSSFTRVHLLLQRLRNLLTLAEWARRQLSSAHLWHGVRVPCAVCRDTPSSSDVRRGCWSRERRALKQHIWLGRLVQWFGIMGLLPKYPDAHEVKRISQMWKEMEHSHQKSRVQTHGWEEEEEEEEEDGGKERRSSFIQGLVTELRKNHGCVWTSEDCSERRYPPPDLQALLKLVLVSCIDNMSVQAILMYFILDVTNFLQCRDDLLRSFCLAFTIPGSFSQLIRAVWMLDHGHVKASMELLLSPRAAMPWLPWQHRCIIHCLLTRKQPSLALRYLHWARPAVGSAEDAKLLTDVLLQNSCVSDAWALLRRGEGDTGIKSAGMKTERPPCPLSAQLYRAQDTVSPGELVQLVRRAAMEVRNPRPQISEVVWPKQAERKSNGRETCLSAQALSHLTPGSSPVDVTEEQTAHPEECEEELIHNQQQETQVLSSSCEDLTSEPVSSSSSFTTASSLPLLRRDRPHVYQSTLTLQRISSLLTDSENQSVGDDEEEEEEESRPPSSVAVLPDRPELLPPPPPLPTPDGATDLVSHSQRNKGVSAERFLSAEGRTLGEALPPDERMDVSPQLCSNGICQSHDSLRDSRLESHSFFSPDFGVTAASEAPGDGPQTGQMKMKTDENCLQRTSAGRDHCRVASWWRRDAETGRASGGLMFAAEPRAAVTSGNSGPLNQPYSYGLLTFMDFTAELRGDKRGGKQADKEEPAGWSRLTASQGAMRSGRTRPRKGKRAKRA